MAWAAAREFLRVSPLAEFSRRPNPHPAADAFYQPVRAGRLPAPGRKLDRIARIERAVRVAADQHQRFLAVGKELQAPGIDLRRQAGSHEVCVSEHLPPIPLYR